MKICKLSEVFAVNENITAEKVGNIVIIHNLYKDYTKIREYFLHQPWPISETDGPTENGVNYIKCAQMSIRFRGYPFSDIVSKVIKEAYDKITKHSYNAIRTLIFQQKIDNISEFGQIHRDESNSPNEAFTVLTYLNTEEECSGGTAFFPMMEFSEKYSQVNFWSSEPSHKTNDCVKIKMKPGHTIIFNSCEYHAVWLPENKWYNVPRITMVSRFVTEEFVKRHGLSTP